MVGNFIADFVKGNKKENYAPGIKTGIELHRKIDDFTDHHSIHLRSQQRIREQQGKYAGVVIDLFYDHFLAKNFSDYHPVKLQQYSENTYEVLKKNWDLLPPGVHYFLPYMIERNWLLNYASIEGIGRALNGLSVRVAFKNNMCLATEELQQHYVLFEKDFREFFPLLVRYVKENS